MSGCCCFAEENGLTEENDACAKRNVAGSRVMTVLCLVLLAGCSCRWCEPRGEGERMDGDAPPESTAPPIELARARSTHPLVEAHIELEIGRRGVSVDGRQVVEIADGGVVYEGEPETTWVYNIRPIWEPMNQRSKTLVAAEGDRGCGGPWGIGTIVAHKDTSYDLLTRILDTIGQSRIASLQMVVESPDRERRGLRLCMVRFDSGCAQCWRDHWARIGGREEAPRRRRLGSLLDGTPDAGSEPLFLNLMLSLGSNVIQLSSSQGILPGPEGDVGSIRIPHVSNGGGTCLDEDSPEEPCSEVAQGCRSDISALHRHITEIKARHPAEFTIIVTACPEATWRELVEVIESVQGTPAEPLFPLITLTRGLH